MQVDDGHRASMEAFLLKTFLLVLVSVAERKKQLLGMSSLPFEIVTETCVYALLVSRCLDCMFERAGPRP